MTERRHWDQLIADRFRTRRGRRSARAALTSLLGVALLLGMAPGVASAHHFEEPGNKGAQISVTPDGSEPAVGGISPGLLPVQTVAVEGKSYPANTRIELRQCTPTACTTVGAVIADAAGAFRADVVVSVHPAAGDTAGRTVACASQGPNQCTIVAVQLFGSYTNEPSDAAHNICFAPIAAVGGACSTTRIPTTTTTTTTSAWEPAAPMSVARHGLATAVGVNGRVYALGGTDVAFHTTQAGTGSALDAAEMLDPCGTGTWTPIAPMPTPRTQFSAATGPDGRIYAIGGRDRFNGTALATVDAYDPATNTWSSVASLAVPRADLAATTGPDGLIYAIGGSVGGGSVGNVVGIAVPTVETYDVAADRWTAGTPLPPAVGNTLPRAGLGAATGPDGRVYAISGDPNGSGLNLSDIPAPGPVESYSPGPGGTPGIWRKEASPAYADGRLPFGLAATTGPDGLIYAIGGQAPSGPGDSARTVYSFDTAGDAWTLSQEALTTRRWYHGVAAGKDGRIYAIGGVDYDTDAVDPVPPMATTEALQVAPNMCPPGSPPPADFDGDGDTDVSVFRPSSGTWFVKDGQTSSWAAEGDIPVPADYDGDRKTDVAIFRPSTGLWAIRGSAGTDTFVTYGISTDIPVPADYDGDGKADMAIFRPAFGLWYVRHSSTGADVPVTFGIEGDVPVPADYDGDAKADLAIFRNGTWFTLPSGGGDYIATSYGSPGDIPVPGDYDADRTTDRAVFRPSDGTWSLHRSSDNTDESFGFGISGDIPVPGDYNADRITDPAVFRPSTGEWFVETGQTHSWGVGTDIPLPLPYTVRKAYFGGTS